jgi:hypothetical protein
VCFLYQFVKMKRQNKSGKSKKQMVVQIRGSLPRHQSGSDNLNVRSSVQPKYTFDIPLAPTQFTVATGAIATSTALNTAIIPSFASRFATLFQEYRILGVTLTIRQTTTPAGGGNSGVTCFFIDEKSATAPTAAVTLDRPRIEASNLADTSDKVHLIKWVANDLLDLDFTATGTAYTPMWYKVYTDVANFGCNATTTLGWIVSGIVRVELRGLA